MTELRTFRAEKIKPPRNFRMPVLPEGLPVDLEIGCGVGWHPIRHAVAHPERYVIAIEHTRTRFAAFEARLRNHPGMKNLLAVHADAIAWVTHALAPESVDRIFLLYPNPFPKRRDLSKRWYAMPFMARLLQILNPHGEIVLVTNERFYFDEAREFLSAKWGMSLLEELEFRSSGVPGGSARTHFEKKYLSRGETCFQLRAGKSLAAKRRNDTLGISWKRRWLMKRILTLFAVSGLLASVATAATKQVDVSVKGMMCSSCAKKMQSKLKAQDSVQDAKVDLKKGLVHLTLKDGKDLSDDQIKSIINDKDYSVAQIQRK